MITTVHLYKKSSSKVEVIDINASTVNAYFFTTLDLAKKHVMLTGHTEVHLESERTETESSAEEVDNTNSDTDFDDLEDRAIIIPEGGLSNFMKSQFDEQ